MTRDPLAVLTAIRPTNDLDTDTSPSEQTALRERIMADRITTGHTSQKRPRRRRLAAAALTAVLASTVGVGTAAATGNMPQAFTDAFSYWFTSPVAGHEGIDPSAARRVATAPGHDGMVFTVLTAKGANGYQCTAGLFETSRSAQLTGPADFTDATGSICRTGPDHGAFGSGSSVSVAPQAYTYFASAGSAVRAEVRTTDGGTYPALLVEGQFWGWFPTPTPGSAHPVLIGYAADGTAVGRTVL